LVRKLEEQKGKGMGLDDRKEKEGRVMPSEFRNCQECVPAVVIGPRSAHMVLPRPELKLLIGTIFCLLELPLGTTTANANNYHSAGTCAAFRSSSSSSY